jgi:type 1 glutamine amidotransferase/mono/diheme cytochrome c family protein
MHDLESCPRWLRLFIPALLTALGAIPAAAEGPGGAGSTPAKVVLIAGPITGHPKDTHEYEKSVILLKHLLDRASNLRGLRTEVHFGGWPEDPAALDGASTIVLISDGSDRREADHPLYVGKRLDEIGRHMARGAGLVHIHWTTFHPCRHHDRITEWLGGYFDYESGPGERRWHSEIQTREWDVEVLDPAHPVCRGVRPFRLREEFYFKLRFREEDPRLRPLLSIDRGRGRDGVVAWALERADRGRAFGLTGGHFFANWWQADFRRLVLNAIVWSAGLEVPDGGVASELEERFRALVLTGHDHPAHDWMAKTAALVHILEQDPRLLVDVSEDPEDLAGEKLGAYVVLVLNYSNWDRPGLSAAAKDGLVRYLKRGGGLVVLHFANGAFHFSLPRPDSDWEEYRTRIVRRVWLHGEGGSGHDAFGRFTVRILPLGHEITADLADFETEDELYFRQSGELPIEPLAVARSKVTGADEPMAWAYGYEGGRVFQTVLGHADRSLRAAGALVRRGTVWAARRKGLSFDPPAQRTEGALFREGSSWVPRAAPAPAKAPAAPAPTESPRPQDPRKDAREPEKPLGAPAGRSEERRDALPPSPGLDGGVGGHWGLEGEGDWVDGRWSRTETGPFLSSSLETPSGPPGGTVRKALSVRVGDAGEAAVCFDTATLTLRAGWKGGFLSLSPKRFGLIEMPRIAGEVVFAAAEGPAWGDARVSYRGLYLHAKRVVLSYSVGGADVLESPWFEDLGGIGAFTRTMEIGAGSETVALGLVKVAGARGSVLRDAKVHAGVLEDGASVTAVAVEAVDAETRGVPRKDPSAAGAARLRVEQESSLAIELPGRSGGLRVKLWLWRGPKEGLGRFLKAVGASGVLAPLAPLLAPGEPLWKETLTTRGRLGTSSGAYAIDTVPLPVENPYRALFFLSGVDFLSNGDAAVSTAHGEVWTARGVDDDLGEVSWRRFATGLYQPLGLRVVADRVFVLGRDQITRLEDRNGDGEADFYASFNNACETSSGGHDYHTSLETDAAGNFYYLSPKGLHRVSFDGRSHETLASGWRHPNGLGVGPGGVITVAPQEGEWTPASHISEVKTGGYYGYPGPKPTPERPAGYDPPLCWIPRHVDNSSGGQVWAPQSWGPLSGQPLSLSFGRSSALLVLRDRVDGQPQGAVVPLGWRFESGVMRGRVHPQDGQLYVAGMNGWTTNAVADGCFQRVRFTGGEALLPVALRVHENGLWLSFSAPLDPTVAADVESYAVSQWNYQYSAAYGSKEYSARNPGRVGHDALRVAAAVVLDDRKSVFLVVPGIEPVHQLHVQAFLESGKGAESSFDIYASVHRPRPPFEVDAPVIEELSRDAAAAPEGERGLVLRLRSLSGGPEDSRVARLAALYVPEGAPPSPFLGPGPFEAVWEGEIEVPRRGQFVFSAEGRGSLRLDVDGQTLLSAEGEDLSQLTSRRVVLKRGERRFRLEYQSPASGDARVRAFWEGSDFGREAVPPAAFRFTTRPAVLDQAERLRRGRELFALRGCMKCHRAEGKLARLEQGMPELAADAPSFAGIGGRLHARWMARWVLGQRPPAAEATALTLSCPSCLPLTEVGRDGRARDVAAYLSALAGEASQELALGADEVRRGAALFAQLGCEACHDPPGRERIEGASATPSLDRSGKKWKPHALKEYLEAPARHFRWTRMPDFWLSSGEAAALAAYLLAPSSDRTTIATDSGGDPERGKELVAALGCLKCHRGAPLEDRSSPPALEDLVAKGWERRGCLADSAAAQGRAPEHGFSAADVEALRAFALTGLDSLARDDVLEFSARQFRSLGCGACHSRDGVEGRWSAPVSPVAPAPADPEMSAAAAGILAQVRPDLTWTGEQLRTDWLRRFLAGDRLRPLRPWLQARMPVFEVQAHGLAHGMAWEHGCAPSGGPDGFEDASAPGAADLVEAGRRLLSSIGGFGCISCHAAGNQPAQMQLHFGTINLSASRERLRQEYYLRWMLNPQRINPLTPMPAFADAKGRSVLGAVLDGDARSQFSAIWDALARFR